MTPAQVLQMQFDRLTQEFRNTLGNLGAQRLAWRPAARANDIASMLWHSARAWDGYLAFLDNKTDAFDSEDWARRFGMPGESKDHVKIP
jgi:DinB family protein